MKEQVQSHQEAIVQAATVAGVEITFLHPSHDDHIIFKIIAYTALQKRHAVRNLKNAGYTYGNKRSNKKACIRGWSKSASVRDFFHPSIP